MHITFYSLPVGNLGLFPTHGVFGMALPLYASYHITAYLQVEKSLVQNSSLLL